MTPPRPAGLLRRHVHDTAVPLQLAPCRAAADARRPDAACLIWTSAHDRSRRAPRSRRHLGRDAVDRAGLLGRGTAWPAADDSARSHDPGLAVRRDRPGRRHTLGTRRSRRGGARRLRGRPRKHWRRQPSASGDRVDFVGGVRMRFDAAGCTRRLGAPPLRSLPFCLRNAAFGCSVLRTGRAARLRRRRAARQSRAPWARQRAAVGPPVRMRNLVGRRRGRRRRVWDGVAVSPGTDAPRLLAARDAGHRYGDRRHRRDLRLGMDRRHVGPAQRQERFRVAFARICQPGRGDPESGPARGRGPRGRLHDVARARPLGFRCARRQTRGVRPRHPGAGMDSQSDGGGARGLREPDGAAMAPAVRDIRTPRRQAGCDLASPRLFPGRLRNPAERQ